jgi:hypothetical protein
LIGDEVALGIGDWCSPGQNPGCSGSILRSLQDLKRLRHEWRPMNWGIPGATSLTWLPPSSDKSKEKGRTFQSRFDSTGAPEDIQKIELQQARDIAIIALGRNDFHHGISGKQTFYNIQEIAKELASKFAFVFVCTLPNWSQVCSPSLPLEPKLLLSEANDSKKPSKPLESAQLKETSECNKMLREWIAG